MSKSGPYFVAYMPEPDETHRTLAAATRQARALANEDGTPTVVLKMVKPVLPKKVRP